MVHSSEQTTSADEPAVVGASDEFRISPRVRDRILLDVDTPWPQGAKSEQLGEPAWTVAENGAMKGIPLRRLYILNETLEPRPTDTPLQLEQEPHYWEALLQFPTAPVYATHRARPLPYGFDKGETLPNLHTMRILGSGTAPTKRIKHVYLLHNGLNETRDLLFHYRLAAWILNRRPDAVCIIRPLPGHLTRYPFYGGFSETPLDSYLRDPMELFRQFLRYMIETQWLLSVIVPRSYYAVIAGGRLLAGEPGGAGSGDPTADPVLAGRMAEEWKLLFDTSLAKAGEAGRDEYSKKPVEYEEMADVVRAIRALLRWEPADSAQSPKKLPEEGPASGAAEYPYVHMVGYSMGGFMAQAGFFGWPQVVASCTNVFAGGALRDLAPTAFAHPEEWQAVLHALRYEFDSALAEGPLTGDGDHRTAGIDAKDFSYMKRIFYEVFLQYYKGGYSSRVAEFSRRLLFVVGGDDPIVRTRNVLDAGPPEGITLLQMADVTHFPGGATWKPNDQQLVEREQRTFWLPEIGRVIARFSERAAVALHNTVAKCWQEGQGAVADEISQLATSTPQQTIKEDGLGNSAFERELDALLATVSQKGWLLVSRNEIPPVFLGRQGIRLHAKALHHSEELIYNYSQSLHARADMLWRLKDRMTLLIPEHSEQWFFEEYLRRKLFARSETPGAAHLPSLEEHKDMWEHFRDTWCSDETVRVVQMKEYALQELSPLGQHEAKRLGTERLSLGMLPDVWIGFSPELCRRMAGELPDRDVIEKMTVHWATELAQEDPGDAETRLKLDLKDNKLVAVKVSAAELNPRYRGHRMTDHKEVGRVLRHWALSRCSSRPMATGAANDNGGISVTETDGAGTGQVTHQ